jgi:putative membrane protein
MSVWESPGFSRGRGFKGLVALVILFTGWFGFIIFLIATPVGMIASYAKIRKINAMGVIMLPVILYFI